MEELWTRSEAQGRLVDSGECWAQKRGVTAEEPGSDTMLRARFEQREGAEAVKENREAPFQLLV
jgi:hypothetical protein